MAIANVSHVLLKLLSTRQRGLRPKSAQAGTERPPCPEAAAQARTEVPHRPQACRSATTHRIQVCRQMKYVAATNMSKESE